MLDPVELAASHGLTLEPTLARLAFVHRSYSAEHDGEEPNERLEFLGDAILGLVVTDWLYHRYPDLREGDLARIRASVVSADALAPIASRLNLGAALLLGNGEERSGGREKPSLLADALEALIGAIYCSGGLPAAQAFVLEQLEAGIEEEAARSVLGDPKNVLQEQASRLGLDRPLYALSERGPDHAKRFSAEVRVGEVLGKGEGRSKKQAERNAAIDAVRALEAAAAASPIRRA